MVNTKRMTVASLSMPAVIAIALGIALALGLFIPQPSVEAQEGGRGGLVYFWRFYE